jgi:fermentation-respiration switch protein FrsA (DUF1100 family)
MTSIAKMFTTSVLTIAVLALGAAYKFQLSLIYPSNIGDSRTNVSRPSSLGLPFEELWLKTKDGIKLHAYLCLSPGSKKTVIVLTPNAGNIGHSLPIVQLFAQQFGYNVLIYSYRGYGLSGGIADEAGLKIDADTVMSYVLNHEVLNKTSVILYGRSLGGAVGIYISSKNYEVVKGVILENTFLSLRKCIPHIFPFLKYVTGMCHQVWPSEVDILKVSPTGVKWLFISGTDDEIVPPDHMLQLYELCPAEDKKSVVMQGGKHNDTIASDGYWDYVWDFTKSISPIEKV